MANTTTLTTERHSEIDGRPGGPWRPHENLPTRYGDQPGSESIPGALRMAHTAEMALSDYRAAFFLTTVVERCRRILGHSESQVRIEYRRTDYVIPGVLMTMTDCGHANRVWLGANENRLFYIQRFALLPAEAKRLFQFCFEGASKVGWAFNFEPAGDAQVSVWGTVHPDVILTEPTGATLREQTGLMVPLLRLTADGAFWVNDVALMLQSSIRVAQRNVVYDGEAPAPL